jgi:hypothetical protein
MFNTPSRKPADRKLSRLNFGSAWLAGVNNVNRPANPDPEQREGRTSESRPGATRGKDQRFADANFASCKTWLAPHPDRGEGRNYLGG